MSKYIVDILDKDKYALEIGITKNGSPASQRVLDAVKVGIPYEEKPHGKWVQVTDEDGDYLYHKCSNCGQKVESELDNPPFFNFCMDCGASMKANDGQVASKLDNNTALYYSLTNGYNFIEKRVERNETHN